MTQYRSSREATLYISTDKFNITVAKKNMKVLDMFPIDVSFDLRYGISHDGRHVACGVHLRFYDNMFFCGECNEVINAEFKMGSIFDNEERRYL